MTEQTITNPKQAPAGANVRIGSRGGMYYQNNTKPTTPHPDQVLSGPGYEILMFKEQTGYRIKYKGPNAEKVLERLRK